jgi:hypothetical protein
MTSKQKSALAFFINEAKRIAERIGTAEEAAGKRYAAETTQARHAMTLGALSFHAENTAKELRALVKMVQEDFPAAAQLAERVA